MKQPGRLTRFQQSLPAQAAIVTSNLNRYYLSGFLGTAGTLLVTKDKVFYLADGRYFEAVSQKVPFAKAVLVKSKGWDELAALCEANNMEAVASLIQKKDAPEAGTVLGGGKLSVSMA